MIISSLLNNAVHLQAKQLAPFHSVVVNRCKRSVETVNDSPIPSFRIGSQLEHLLSEITVVVKVE